MNYTVTLHVSLTLNLGFICSTQIIFKYIVSELLICIFLSGWSMEESNRRDTFVVRVVIDYQQVICLSSVINT